MINFVCIFSIFLEIIVVTYLVQLIIKCEKKVNEYNKKLLIYGKIILEVNKKLRETIKKINKVVSIFTNKKFIQIKKIIQFSITTIQIVLLIKSLDLTKGKKFFSFKNMKKILFAHVVKEMIKNLAKCS